MPPVLTKTWFHTGAYLAETALTRRFDAAEYYRESDPRPGSPTTQTDAMQLPDTRAARQRPARRRHPHPLRPPPHEAREAARALQRLTAATRDLRPRRQPRPNPAPTRSPNPTTPSSCCNPVAANRHAVCHPHPRENAHLRLRTRPLRHAHRRRGRRPARRPPGHPRHRRLRQPAAHRSRSPTHAATPTPPPSSTTSTRDALHTTQARLLATLTDQRLHQPDRHAHRPPDPPARADPHATSSSTCTPGGADPGHHQPARLRRSARPGRHRRRRRPRPAARGPRPRRRHHRRPLPPAAHRHPRPVPARRPHRPAPPRPPRLPRPPVPALHPHLHPRPARRHLPAQPRRPDRQPAARPRRRPRPPTAATSPATPSKPKPSSRQPIPRAGGGHPVAPSATLPTPPTRRRPSSAPRSRTSSCRPAFTDPYGNTTTVSYDPYDLLVTESRDPLDNRTSVGARGPDGTIARDGLDYRVLAPRLVTDPNRNRTAVAYDALGLVAGTAVMGKPEQPEGDTLDGFDPDLDDTVIAAHLGRPAHRPPHDPRAARPPASSTTWTPTARTAADPHPQPVVAYTLARETHTTDLDPGQQSKIQHTFAYTDGFGRELQHKNLAEPGPAPQRDPGGDILVDTTGQPVLTDHDITPDGSAPAGPSTTTKQTRSANTSRSSPTPTATNRTSASASAPSSSTTRYRRPVVTLHPDHTYDKTVFDPWRHTSFDVNDASAPRNTQTGDPRTDPDTAQYVADYFTTLPTPPGQPWQTWYQQRINNPTTPYEQQAAQKAAAHADTPTTTHLDTLGQGLPHRHPQPCQRPRPPRRRHRNPHPHPHRAGHPRTPTRHPRHRTRRHQRRRSDRHALPARPAGQPHPPRQHGSRRPLDAQRHCRKTDSGLGQPRPQRNHQL